MTYYRFKTALVASLIDNLPLEKIESVDYNQLKAESSISFLFARNPINSKSVFLASHLNQLFAKEETVAFLDSQRIEVVEIPQQDKELLQSFLEKDALQCVNFSHPDWQRNIFPKYSPEKKRVNILAIGDVGSTLLTGLKLMGGDVIDSIGICDISTEVTARWEMEMNQISLPWEYNSFPQVDIITPDQLFDCDAFVFVASKGIPAVDSKVKDVRMAQFEANSKIIAHYAKLARKKQFKGLFCAVSDPVDPLAKTAYLESNKDDEGKFDFKGLAPEQVHGFGLGVMNARAAYYAKKDSRFEDFLTKGRTFGPHGEDLVVANSITNYNHDLSCELTKLTVTANLAMRELGYKPYVAPALSSGALSILLTLRGEWHCGSSLMGGVFMGAKCRYTKLGIQTENLTLDDQLFARIDYAAKNLAKIV